MSHANQLEPPRNKIPMSKFDPDIQNYEQLSQWLRLHDARHVWSAYSDNGPTIMGLQIGSAIVLVTLHRQVQGQYPGGWELSVSPSTNGVRETFEEIERQLGLEVAR